jgi:hypothetical protein
VVNGEEFAPFEITQVEAKRRDVLGDVFFRLFECNEDPRFTIVERPADEVLNAEQRLSAASGPAQQRGATFRDTAPRHLIKARNAGADFGETWKCGSARRRIRARAMRRFS